MIPIAMLRRMRHFCRALFRRCLIVVLQSLLALPAVLPWSLPAHADSIESSKGAWAPVQDWPLIAVHASLLFDGRVMTYGTNRDGRQTGMFIYDVWDPAAPDAASHLTLPNGTGTDTFCSAQVLLPGKRGLFIGGGDINSNGRTTNKGNNDSNLFQPAANTLARGADMQRKRWYATAITTMDGSTLLVGGNGGADFPELRHADGSFGLLSGAPTDDLSWFYPRSFVAPSGDVVGLSERRLFGIATGGNGMRSFLGEFRGANVTRTASAVMYAPGKVLQCGGGSNGATVLDFSGPQVGATDVAPMSTRRQWVSTTVLPTGEVLATGGSEVANKLEGVNTSAEIWHPKSSAWTVGASARLARLYHSTALLLPDGRVLVAGGGAPGPLVNTNAEIYSPPYLFAKTGGPASRPVIANAPLQVRHGQDFSFTMAGSERISRVTLVKTGAVTHSFNTDQRFMELPFDQNGAAVESMLPASAAIVTPGHYLLFALDAHGTPSVARIIDVPVPASRVIPARWTAPMGGGGSSGSSASSGAVGKDFRLECAGPDEAVAGLDGWLGGSPTVLAGVRPLCVRIDTAGHWIGLPRATRHAGASAGLAFRSECPADQAVVALGGRMDARIDQLRLRCQALNAGGIGMGQSTQLAPVGSTGGNPRAEQHCGAGMPANGIYGRSDTLIDAMGLLCRDPAANATALAGSTGGSSFELPCADGEVLVGLAGRMTPLIQRIAPVCVRVANRAWVGTPAMHGVAGGQGGAVFSRQCPANHAMTGFSGFYAQALDQIDLRCRPVGEPDAAPVVNLEKIGIHGAHSRYGGTHDCGAGRQATGIFGHAGALIESLGMHCADALPVTSGHQVGTAGGTPFQLGCRADEALVGFQARGGSGVVRLTPHCVQLDAAGKWVGLPVARGSAGGGGAHDAERVCGQDQAMAGISGRAGAQLEALAPLCRPLTAGGRVKWDAVALEPAGDASGAQGTAFGPWVCRNDQPAQALRGWSAAAVNAVSLVCRQ